VLVADRQDFRGHGRILREKGYDSSGRAFVLVASAGFRTNQLTLDFNGRRRRSRERNDALFLMISGTGFLAGRSLQRDFGAHLLRTLTQSTYYWKVQAKDLAGNWSTSRRPTPNNNTTPPRLSRCRSRRRFDDQLQLLRTSAGRPPRTTALRGLPITGWNIYHTGFNYIYASTNTALNCLTRS